MKLLTVCLTLLVSGRLIISEKLKTTEFTEEQALTCSQGLTDCRVKQSNNECVEYEEHEYVSGVAAYALLCHSHKGWRPCLKIQLDITTEGLLDSSLLQETSYKDRRGENEEKQHGSSLGLPVYPSTSVQVCYQSPTFSGSVEFFFTLSIESTKQQMWMSLVVLRSEFDFGSKVSVFSSLAVNLTNIFLPTVDTVCSQGLDIEWCNTNIVYAEINHKEGTAALRLNASTEHIKACQMMERGGECFRLEWKENPLKIPLSLVAPCLCFQIWFDNGPRKEFCPFVNETALSGSNVSVSVLESPTYDAALDRETTALVWNITSPCRLEVELQLCKKTFCFSRSCQKIDVLRNSIQRTSARLPPQWRRSNRHWQLQGEFVEVERHPSLCVQIKIKGMEGHFDPICPFEGISGAGRPRWILAVLIGVVLMCLTVFGAYGVQGALKGCLFKWLKVDNSSKTVGRGQVVLLYPPDPDSTFTELVCRLGSTLSSLDFDVTSDLWSSTELSALGPVPWLHSRLHRLQCYGGSVVLVLTHAAWKRAEDWWKSRGERAEQKETCSDVFSASLSCILADYLQGRAGERFVLVQFETQPSGPPDEKGCLPELFSGLPVFRLPSQSLAFLTELTLRAQKGQQRNERAIKRRTRAGVLRARARTLAGTLCELKGDLSYRLTGTPQDCKGFRKEDPWVTIPLKPKGSTPPASPELHSKNNALNRV